MCRFSGGASSWVERHIPPSSSVGSCRCSGRGCSAGSIVLAFAYVRALRSASRPRPPRARTGAPHRRRAQLASIRRTRPAGHPDAHRHACVRAHPAHGPGSCRHRRNAGPGCRRVAGQRHRLHGRRGGALEVVPSHHGRQLAQCVRRNSLAYPVDDLVIRNGVPRLGRLGDTGGDQRSPRRPVGLVAVHAADRVPASVRSPPASPRSTSPNRMASGSRVPLRGCASATSSS